MQQQQQATRIGGPAHGVTSSQAGCASQAEVAVAAEADIHASSKVKDARNGMTNDEGRTLNNAPFSVGVPEPSPQSLREITV